MVCSMFRALALAAALVAVSAACGTGERGDSTPVTSGASPAGAEAPTVLPTLAPAQPPAATPVPAVVDRLKADLAGRLGVAAAGITVVSLEPFTWPDGCLGLGGPGVVCTQALVPGWLAVLRAPDGKEYRYRGTGDRFAIEP